MRFILVLLAASTVLMSGCVVAPYGDEHRGDPAYRERDRDRGDRGDRGEHRGYGDDHDRDRDDQHQRDRY